MATVPQREPRPVTVYSHSNLFYMWPVWFLGFVFGLIITPLSGQVLAVVPKDTEPHQDLNIPNIGTRDALVLPKGKTLETDADGNPIRPKLHIAATKNLGNWYLFITALVIFFSTVTLRGLWSVMIIGTVIFLIIIFWLAGWWENIVTALGFLDVRINQGGYIFFSVLLLILWILVVVFYDKQVYMTFAPGQVRVRQEIGEGEMAFDATGVTFQRLRNDWFRHWILGLGIFGLGTGDLIVRTGGAHPTTIDFPNVLFMDRRIKAIERLLQAKAVVWQA